MGVRAIQAGGRRRHVVERALRLRRDEVRDERAIQVGGWRRCVV